MIFCCKNCGTKFSSIWKASWHNCKKIEILDLACGENKTPNSFGIDYLKYSNADFAWDLEKTLPKRFWNKWDKVIISHAIDHFGNPQKLLLDCRKYLKTNGTIEIILDNAEYWRFHKKSFPFAEYHALAKDWVSKETGHKLMFQPEHLERLLKYCDYKNIKWEYYKEEPKRKIDKLLPDRFGYKAIKMEAKK